MLMFKSLMRRATGLNRSGITHWQTFSWSAVAVVAGLDDEVQPERSEPAAAVLVAGQYRL
jgi:hypothetical protein